MFCSVNVLLERRSFRNSWNIVLSTTAGTPFYLHQLEHRSIKKTWNTVLSKTAGTTFYQDLLEHTVKPDASCPEKALHEWTCIHLLTYGGGGTGMDITKATELLNQRSWHVMSWHVEEGWWMFYAQAKCKDSQADRLAGISRCWKAAPLKTDNFQIFS